MNVVSHYLSHYAEREIRLTQGWPPTECFDRAVVVPLLGEEATSGLWQTLERAADFSGVRTLAIVVVNATADHPAPFHDANAATLNALTRDATRVSGEPPAWLAHQSDALSLLVIDRARAPWQLGRSEGVGHARKIGSDIALALFAAGYLSSDIFSTTDADARVAQDYFAWDSEAGTVAILHPFRHEVDNGESLPLTLYEISLRYYVLGLRFARSPYAFHTIGSTLSFRASAYAQVRGFPKREAAEDFYFLDKLAKVGPVCTGGGEVRLLARPSSRVPFGTGRAMTTIGRQLGDGDPFRMYHPAAFRALRQWLAAARQFANERYLDGLRAQLDPPVDSVLTMQGAWGSLQQAASQRKTALDLERHIFTWFDGLRTLKFIHALRDCSYPSVPWHGALASADFLSEMPRAQDPLEYLAWVRRLDS